MEIEEDVTGLDQDINFLFEETIIQDERIFNLEDDLDLAEDNIESKFFSD